MSSSFDSRPPSKPHHRISTSAISSKTCPICLSQIGHHRPAILANCAHAYCLPCLLRWSNYKRTCPLCNSPFDSYFSSTHLSRLSFRLLPLRSSPHPPRRVISHPVALRRVIRRTRDEINGTNRRSRPVPRRRSFGRSSVPSEVILEEVLQWRASIYKLGLRAVPFSDRNFATPNMSISSSHREAILHRIEPWICRELQAILEDPNPIIIVHVATSMYLSSIEKNTRVFSGCTDTEDAMLAPLQPFLHEWTNMFWHELRCFAESSFTMDTYDEVVEYIRQEDGREDEHISITET